MITKTLTIPFEIGDKFDFWPFGDLHWDSAECDKKAFKADLSRMSPKAIATGNGDWFSSIPVVDKRYSKTEDGDKTEAFINNSVDEIASYVLPYKERFIGLGIGNHERKYIQKFGADPIRLLCKELSSDGHKVMHLGYSSIIRISFQYIKGSRTFYYTIRQHHGWGGAARTEGGNVTKFAREAKNWDADLQVYSHVHDPDMRTLPPILSINHNGNLVSRKRLLVITGSYQKTFNNEVYPSYAEQMGFAPTEIGTTPIILECTANGIKTSYGGTV